MAKSAIINGIDVFIGEANDGNQYVYIDNIATTQYPIVDVDNETILTSTKEPESHKCIWCRTDLDEYEEVIYYIDARHPTPQKKVGVCCDICLPDLQEFSQRITNSAVVAELI